MRGYKFAASIDAATFGPRYAVETLQTLPEKQNEWKLEFDEKDRLLLI